MATLTSLYNLSLSHIGIGLKVASDAENSPEAEALRTNYENVRKSLLRRSEWNFAQAFINLSQIEDGASFNYAYGYTLPPDYIKAIRVNRIPAANQSTRFQVAGGVLYTDDTTVALEYTRDSTDCTEWDDEFTNALSWYLAAAIAPTLSSDPNLGMRLLDRADAFLNRAKDSDTHETKLEIKRGPAYSHYRAARGWGMGGDGLHAVLLHDLGSVMGDD